MGNRSPRLSEVKFEGSYHLGKNTSRHLPLTLVGRGHVYMDEASSFLDNVEVCRRMAKVKMENHTFIHTLVLPNGGEIFFMGDNHSIAHLSVDDRLIVHVKPNIDWKRFVQTASINGTVEIKEDQEADN